MAGFSEAERVEVWDRWQAGETTRSIGRQLGRTGASIRAFVESTGGVRPHRRFRAQRHLTVLEREEISRGVAAGEPLRVIAGRLGRAASTVSRELARNGGPGRYRAHRADRVAWQRARRPKSSKPTHRVTPDSGGEAGWLVVTAAGGSLAASYIPWQRGDVCVPRDDLSVVVHPRPRCSAPGTNPVSAHQAGVSATEVEFPL